MKRRKDKLIDDRQTKNKMKRTKKANRLIEDKDKENAKKKGQIN